MEPTRGKFERTDIWREGEWLDLWSVVHFLSGSLVGFGFYLLHLGALDAVLLALVSLTCYEMWEALVKIEETLSNRFMDVVVGMVSFIPTFFWLAPRLSTPAFWTVFGVAFVVDIFLSRLGWRASQKAAELQKRVHTKFDLERAKLQKQKARLRKRFHRRKHD